MNPDIKARWVAALRSGDYEQGKGRLRIGDTFCCLGVLCDIAVEDGVIAPPEYNIDSYPYYGPCSDSSSSELPRVVSAWAGLMDATMPEHADTYRPSDPFVRNRTGGLATLAQLNDSGEYSFHDIAEVIEEQL